MTRDSRFGGSTSSPAIPPYHPMMIEYLRGVAQITELAGPAGAAAFCQGGIDALDTLLAQFKNPTDEFLDGCRRGKLNETIVLEMRAYLTKRIEELSVSIS